MPNQTGSEKPLSAAEKMIDRMKAYSSFRPDQVPEYLKAFKRMIGEFGETRVNRALSLAIDQIPSFPATPAEIRSRIPPLEVVTCSHCENGWVAVDPMVRISDRRYRRCDCLAV